jgi:hypothetical protein
MRSRGIARVAGIVLLAAFLTPAAKAQTVTGAAIAKALGQRRVKGRLPFWAVTKLVVKEEKGSVPFSLSFPFSSAAGPGGWAATKIYTDLNEARRDMALLPEWKNQQELLVNGVPMLDNLVIREYTVQKALPTRQGMAGPQEEYFKNAAGQNVQTGQSYPGGGKQVELLIDTRSHMLDSKTGDVLWKSYLNPTAQYRFGDRTVTAQPVVRPVP